MPLRSKLDLLLRAFKYRNYRLFFYGQGISLVGTWMQRVALSWLIYRITGSTILLGLTSFASLAPSLLLAPFTGPAADRFDRQKLVILTQFLSMLQAAALAALVLFGDPKPWHIIALAAALGVINSFDVPARQAFVIELVDKREDLANAIALNSSMFNSARLIGPSIAGVGIALFGEGICFLLNALSYLAVIRSLTAIKVEGPAAGRRKSGGSFSEGLRYAASFSPIRYILLLLAVGSLCGMPYAVLMPAYVRDVLGGGPQMLGFMMGAAGAGAVLGALRLAMRTTPAGLERRLPGYTFLFGFGLLGFSLSRDFALSAPLIALASYGMISFLAGGNTVVQTLVDEDKRGRVMALHALAFMGMAPFGALISGWAASRIGVANTVMAGALCVIAATLGFMSRLGEISAQAAPVYGRLGGSPEAARELQAAEQVGRPV